MTRGPNASLGMISPPQKRNLLSRKVSCHLHQVPIGMLKNEAQRVELKTRLFPRGGRPRTPGGNIVGETFRLKEKSSV